MSLGYLDINNDGNRNFDFFAIDAKGSAFKDAVILMYRSSFKSIVRVRSGSCTNISWYKKKRGADACCSFHTSQGLRIAQYCIEQATQKPTQICMYTMALKSSRCEMRMEYDTYPQGVYCCFDPDNTV